MHRHNRFRHNHRALHHRSNHQCSPPQPHHHHRCHRHRRLRRAPLSPLPLAVCSVPSHGRARPDSLAAQTTPSTRARLNVRPSAPVQRTVRQARSVRIRADLDATATLQAQTRRVPVSSAHEGPNAHWDRHDILCVLRARIRGLQARAHASSAQSTSSALKAVLSLPTPYVLLARTLAGRARPNARISQTAARYATRATHATTVSRHHAVEVPTKRKAAPAAVLTAHLARTRMSSEA